MQSNPTEFSGGDFGGLSRAAQRRGLVFAELIVGLVIVALVMLAVASVLYAVAQGWNDQDVTQSTQMQANQIYARVQSYLSAAKCIGSYASGSPSGGGDIIFWRADDDPDGQIEEGEVALIVQAGNSLYLYSSSLPYTGQAAQILTASDFAALTPAEIESWSFMQPTLLGGPGSGTSSGSTLDVNGFEVYVTQTTSTPATFVTTQLPIVEFTLYLTSSSGQSLTLYSSAALRPSTQP